MPARAIGRIEVCRVGDAIFALQAVPRGQLILFEALRGALLDRWFALQFDTGALIQGHQELIRAIANLVPAYPEIPAIALCDAPFVESTFLTRWGDDKTPTPALLVALNSYEPLCKAKKRHPDEPITVEHLPFPTSGDADCDTLASLMASFGSEVALQIWERFSAEAIDKVLHALAELRRSPDERVQEYLNHLFFKGREEQADEYRRSLLEDGWETPNKPI